VPSEPGLESVWPADTKDFMAEKRDAENNATAARLLVSAFEMDCLESAVFESTLWIVSQAQGKDPGP
jgi:hypothetical protein